MKQSVAIMLREESLLSEDDKKDKISFTVACQRLATLPQGRNQSNQDQKVRKETRTTPLHVRVAPEGTSRSSFHKTHRNRSQKHSSRPIRAPSDDNLIPSHRLRQEYSPISVEDTHNEQPVGYTH